MRNATDRFYKAFMTRWLLERDSTSDQPVNAPRLRAYHRHSMHKNTGARSVWIGEALILTSAWSRAL